MRRSPDPPMPARRRLLLCAATGWSVGVVAALLAPWQLALLLGWDAAAALLLVWVLRDVVPADARRTAAWSAPEDNSHRGPVVVVSVAAVMSILGTVLGLAEARRVGVAMETALTVAALLAVVLAWAVVHLMYALRYAHLYYRDPAGGIDFHSPEPPDYRDFAYLAFTVGMSFAVSDTDIGDRAIRRTVTQHAMVSYLFGAVIVGLTINVLAAFVR